MKFFFALLGVALAAHSSLPLARPFATQKEYRFRYEASLASGIPLQSTDASLTRIRADVILQIPSDRVTLLRLTKIEIAADKDVPTPEYKPLESLEKRVLSEEHERLLKLPIRVHHRHSLVSEIEFSSEELPWTANIKRAVVNMIQINMKPENMELNYFVSSEKTIEGDCEVVYTIVNEKENTLVSKSVNFDKCERRSDVAYNQRFLAGCPDCDYKMIVPQTVYDYKYEKEELKEVEVRSVYTVSLKEQPIMKTETRARLSLVETNEMRREMEVFRGERQELIYSSEWERSIEEYFKIGDESEKKPFQHIPRKVEMVEEIVAKISELKENTPESVHMFARLVRGLRICSQDELRKIHDKVEKNADPKEQAIIEHALAVAGTKNTIEHLFRHIEQVTPIKFAQLLKSVQETPYPSESIAELLYKLTKTDLCRREPAIRQSVWLAYGAIIRGVVVPTMEKTLVEVPKHLKEKYVNILKKNWEEAETIYEKILALKTFANAGIDISFAELERTILDKKQPTAVRMEAIDSLRLLAEQMPRRIQRALMPIYNNRLEKNEIRMASLVQLLQAKPQQAELFQIVQRMEREPNQHVAAFTYSLLKSYSESTLPAFRNVSSILTPILRVSQYRPKENILSMYQHLPLFHEQSFSGMSVNFGTIFGKDSVIPKDMMTSIETIFGGNWNKYLAQIGFSHQNVEQLFNKILSKLNYLQKKEKTTTRAARLSSSVSMLKELARKLNIRVRNTVSEEAHAMFYLRYKQMDYAVFPINEQMVDELIEKYVRDGSVDMKKVERMLNKDSEFDFTHAGFLLESIIRMPTTIGMPLTITSRMPTIFSGKGKLSFEKVSFGFRARLQAQPSLASTHVHSMTIWIPIFENGVKIVRSAQIATPIHVEIEVSMKNNLEIVLRQQMPEKEKTVVRVESRPIAFVRFFKNFDRFPETEEKTISLPNFDKMFEERTMKTNWAGLEFVLSGNNYRQWTLENVLFGEHQMELIVRPTSRTPKDISVRMVREQVVEKRMDGPKIEKLLQKEMNTEEGEWERRSESSRREHLHKMVRDMELSSAYKHRFVFTVRAVEKSELEILAECEGKLSFCRLTTEMRRPTEERRDWKLTNVIEVVLPRAVSSIDELKEQKHREIQLYSQTKWGSEQKNDIEFVAQLEQSEEQRNLVKEPKTLRGLPAYELLKRVARLNQLKAVAKYEVSPKTEMFFERVFDILKAYNLWNSQLERSENEDRRVLFQLTVDPMFPRLCKLSLETPEKVLRVQNIRMPLALPTITRLPKNVLRHSTIEKSECSIENGKVNTFDDVIFRTPLSTCYTVVAKDCSEEPRYAVLLKNVEKNSEEKRVKIMYEEKQYELEMVDGKMKVLIDGQTIRPEQFEEHNIEKLGDMLYIIDCNEVVVRFDGYSAKVLLGNSEMNTQCGLCGHFDGEKQNEYRTASNEETSDLEEFHRSYIVKSEECSTEVPEKKQYKEYAKESSSSEENYYYDQESKKGMQKRIPTSEEYEDEKKQTKSTEPEMKIRVQEFAHRACFSLEKVPECPKHLTSRKPVEQKVRFGCLPRHNSSARRLLSAINRGDDVVLGDYVVDLKLSFVDNILVPQSCIRV